MYIYIYIYIHIYIYIYIFEGSLEVKLPTIWTDEKQRWSRRIEKRRAEERRSKKRKSQKKADPGARKGRKVAKHCVFPMICGSRGSKSRLAKAAGAEPAGQMRDEKLHPVVARSTFASEKAKSTSRSFGSWDVEKVHGVVARCTFRSQNARRYCAKHISKSKCTKHIKTLHARTTFGSWDVEKVHAVVARSTCRSQNVKNTRGSDHFWKLRCRKSARCCGAKHISKLTCEKNTRVRTTFGRSDVVSRGRRKGLWTLSKVSKTWGFCSIPKTMAGVGHLKRICNGAFSVAGAVQETCSSEKATVSCLTGSVSSSLASRCFFCDRQKF